MLFNLRHTVSCGQIFRWNQAGDSFYVTAGDTIIRAEQRGSRTSFKTSGPFDTRRYFGLDKDLGAIYRSINRDATIAAAIRRYPGLRLIRQEPWECLLSYICSANSSIPQIKRMLTNLAARFGDELWLGDYSDFSFPTPEQLEGATLQQLKDCKVGFRAKFLLNAIRKHDGIEWSREGLMGLDGVGPKIADCVSLFALGVTDAFPIDVWIRRGMEKAYFRGRKASYNDISNFARNHFGKYAGYAQEYLYHFWRHEASQ
jgi:N-glycosylase/DNA lyase